jgi:hypothetical protein
MRREGVKEENEKRDEAEEIFRVAGKHEQSQLNLDAFERLSLEIEYNNFPYRFYTQP